MDGRLEKSLEPINPFPVVFSCFAGEPPDDFPELFQDKRAGIERLIKGLDFLYGVHGSIHGCAQSLGLKNW